MAGPPWTRVLARSSSGQLLLAGGSRRQHALHTCNSKVNHVSVFIVHGPVRVPDGVGKFNQVPKHGRGDDVIELPSLENTQERSEPADRWPPCSTPHLRAGCSTLLSAQGRIQISVNILLNECWTTQCEILMSSLCCMNTDEHINWETSATESKGLNYSCVSHGSGSLKNNPLRRCKIWLSVFRCDCVSASYLFLIIHGQVQIWSCVFCASSVMSIWLGLFLAGLVKKTADWLIHYFTWE